MSMATPDNFRKPIDWADKAKKLKTEIKALENAGGFLLKRTLEAEQSRNELLSALKHAGRLAREYNADWHDSHFKVVIQRAEAIKENKPK